MAYYRYEARNTKENTIIRDTIEAENQKDAMAKLREAGLTVRHIEQTFTKPGEEPWQPEKSFLEKCRDSVLKVLGTLFKD